MPEEPECAPEHSSYERNHRGPRLARPGRRRTIGYAVGISPHSAARVAAPGHRPVPRRPGRRGRTLRLRTIASAGKLLERMPGRHQLLGWFLTHEQLGLLASIRCPHRWPAPIADEDWTDRQGNRWSMRGGLLTATQAR